MSAASDYTEDKVLDHVLGKGTRNFTSPANLFIGLYTASTGLEANAPTAEVSASGTGYARKAVTFNAASGGSASNSATVTFDVATGNWGTVTHVAVTDALNAGNVLFHGPVTTSKSIETGDTFQISLGNLTVSLD
jgi:hypothetical protein